MKAFTNIILFPALALCLIFSSSCSEYQQVLNGDDMEKKYQVAKEYYNNEEYQKAAPLFDDLLRYYRGTPKGEKIAFYYAYCQYGIDSYKVAAFRFKNYYETYPNSDKAEEALYMHAYCLFLQSPRIELDQEPTKKAINAFQVFIDEFPESDRIPDCNEYIDQLRSKIRKKAYNKAGLWYQILDYKAAIVEFQNLLDEYPTIQYKEEIRFKLLKSHFKVAEKSVQSKKQERLEETLERYNQFVERYPNSGFMDEAKEIREQTKVALKKYANRF